MDHFSTQKWTMLAPRPVQWEPRTRTVGNCSKTVGTVAPDPYHGVALQIDPPRYPHTPGTPPPAPHHAEHRHCYTDAAAVVHQASFGYNGPQNIPFWSETTTFTDTTETPLFYRGFLPGLSVKTDRVLVGLFAILTKLQNSVKRMNISGNMTTFPEISHISGHFCHFRETLIQWAHVLLKLTF